SGPLRDQTRPLSNMSSITTRAAAPFRTASRWRGWPEGFSKRHQFDRPPEPPSGTAVAQPASPPHSGLELKQMAEKQLDDLFLDTLKDIYYAERQIVKTLPKMAKAATSPDLKAG